MERPSNGDYYWGAVILGTAAFDYYALTHDTETASSAMRRYTEAPWAKFVLAAGMGALALHFLSESLDPARLLPLPDGPSVGEV